MSGPLTSPNLVLSFVVFVIGLALVFWRRR
jgi:hypothetical protein